MKKKDPTAMGDLPLSYAFTRYEGVYLFEHSWFSELIFNRFYGEDI